MPRFEKDDRFWEIEREGRHVRIRSGRIGDPGQQFVHTAHFEDQAMLDHDRRINAKLEEGYRPIEQPREELLVLEPELERAVVEALDPSALTSEAGAEALRSAWSVLGDWLSARGDVRGELISIDETRTYVDGAGARRLLARRDRLLTQWIPKWFGDYGKLDGRGPISLVWDHGFIAAARIGTQPHALDLARWQMGLRDLVPVLATVLSSPLSRTMRQLRIAELDPLSRRDLTKALPLLKLEQRPALLRLELSGVALGRWVRDHTGNLSQRLALARIGSLAPLTFPELWAPRLQALRISGRELRVFPPLPQLRALELHVAQVDEELRSWLASDWPRLERLWVRASSVHDPWAAGEGPDLSQIFALFDRSPLRELGVQGNTALDQLVWRAMSGPLELDELRVFEFGENELETLLSAVDHFKGVRRLVVEDADEVGRRWDELRAAYGARLIRCATPFGFVSEPIGDDAFESLFDMPGFS